MEITVAIKDGTEGRKQYQSHHLRIVDYKGHVRIAGIEAKLAWIEANDRVSADNFIRVIYCGAFWLLSVY